MAEQLVFDLPVLSAMGRADFFVSPANAAAVAGIEGWRDWSFGKMVLCGPEGSGKTHLAHVWAALSAAKVVSANELIADAQDHWGDAIAVEDVDRAAGNREAEEALFHLHNRLAERGGKLLLTGRGAPAHWPLSLPDLKSRVLQAGVLTLEAPDDALLGAVLVKMAQDRQMPLPPELVVYATRRMERSFAAATRLVEELAARSLRDKCRPSRSMAASILAQG